MKKKEVKAIRHKLIVAVEKALIKNNADLIVKIEKYVKKSINAVSIKSSKKLVL